MVGSFDIFYFTFFLLPGMTSRTGRTLLFLCERIIPTERAWQPIKQFTLTRIFTSFLWTKKIYSSYRTRLNRTRFIKSWPFTVVSNRTLPTAASHQRIFVTKHEAFNKIGNSGNNFVVCRQLFAIRFYQRSFHT